MLKLIVAGSARDPIHDVRAEELVVEQGTPGFLSSMRPPELSSLLL